MSYRFKHVAVVGGAGFIGSNLVEALVKAGVKVRIVDNFSTGKRTNIAAFADSDLVEVVELDITEPDACPAAIKDVEAIFDLAALGVRHSIPRPVRNFQVNGNGTLNLLLAARDAKVQRFLYTSSSEAYGTAVYVPMDENHPNLPMTVYGAGKLAGEALARAFYRTYGLPVTVVRPFNAYGPNVPHEGDCGVVISKFIIRVLNGLPPVIFGDPTNARDFTYVADTVRGIMLAAASDKTLGETVNLAFGQPRSVAEVAEIVLKTTGREDLKPIMERPRPGDVHMHYADTKKARELLGWKAEISLDEGIPKLLEHWKATGADFVKMLSEDKVFNWEE